MCTFEALCCESEVVVEECEGVTHPVNAFPHGLSTDGFLTVGRKKTVETQHTNWTERRSGRRSDVSLNIGLDVGLTSV